MNNKVAHTVGILVVGSLAGIGATFVPEIMMVFVAICMVLLSIRLWILCKFEKYELLVKIWATYTGRTAVRVMDFNHDVIHTLVKQQADGSYVGYHNHILKLGHMRLMPNGYVDPECDTAWCYIWQPVDSELACQLQLSYWDSWPNWDSWKELDHVHMVGSRRTGLQNISCETLK